MHQWAKLVANCTLDSWREALGALLTYCAPGEREQLAAQLGDRLVGDGKQSEALLCFIVAGEMDKAVESWLMMEGADLAKASGLQSLVEVVVMVRAAVAARGLPTQARSDGQVSQALAKYAGLLAGQGSLRTALSYLSQVEVGEGELAELKQRLEQSLAPRAQAPVQAGRQPARGRQSSLTPAPRKISNEPPSYNTYGQQQPFIQPQEPPVSTYQPYKPPSMEREPAPPVPTFPPTFPNAAPASSATRSSNPLLGEFLASPTFSIERYSRWQANSGCLCGLSSSSISRLSASSYPSVLRVSATGTTTIFFPQPSRRSRRWSSTTAPCWPFQPCRSSSSCCASSSFGAST